MMDAASALADILGGMGAPPVELSRPPFPSAATPAYEAPPQIAKITLQPAR